MILGAVSRGQGLQRTVRGTLGSFEASWEMKEKGRKECWSRGSYKYESQREENCRPEAQASPQGAGEEGLETGPNTWSH